MAIEKRMDVVILGLLAHESLSGYEIKKRMDTTLQLFWRASFGSIYPTLKKLSVEDMVTKLETKENGRKKDIYTITIKGQEHLKRWLEEESNKDEIRYETLLKLFFGSEIGEQGTLKHINQFEDKIKKELPFIKQSISILSNLKKDEDAHKYYLLTAMFGKKVYEAYLDWCKETKRLLMEDNHTNKKENR